MKPSWKWFFAGLCVLAVHVDGIARDGLTLELLTGNHSDVVRVIMPLPITSEFSLLPRTDLRLAVETSLAYWRQRRPAEDPSRTDALFDIGVTPLILWQGANAEGWYGQAGIGAHWLSRHYDNNGRRFSTKLQFASQVGLGFVFENRFKLALKLEHVSNAGLKRPNPGVNFIGVQIGTVF